MSLEKELESLKRLEMSHKRDSLEVLHEKLESYPVIEHTYSESKTESLLATLAEIANVATPFVINHKVNQLKEEIKELRRNQPKIDPNTGLKRYI
jgi:tRNA uridine 5-carbamoylmethylation protein Kti12